MNLTSQKIKDAAEEMIKKFPDIHPEIIRNIFISGALFVVREIKKGG